MRSILIRNGRVLDPVQGIDGMRDVYLEGDTVAAVAQNIRKAADVEVDAAGCWVMPGLIDLHVHLRDPGLTWKEDIASGTRAAARGGVTTVVAMPNTKPVADCPAVIREVQARAQREAPIRVLQAGAVTRGQKGEELSDIAGMVAAGCAAISEDGRSVMNAALCAAALRQLAALGVPFLDHCEDAALVRGGCVNADAVSQKEGLPGITNSVEDIIVARDMILAHEAGAHLHLCHCSTKGSYEMMAMAKQRGWDVSAEVCPHHFTLTSADRVPGDTNFKMNPPLRTAADREALREGLSNDVFEVISTDHAPHSAEEKAQSMQKAPFGITGLETLVPLTISELVLPGVITPLQMAAKMSANPARILHLSDRGSLAEGRAADVTVIDPRITYRIDAAAFASKGKNTPFDGREVTGAVRMTICGGNIVYGRK